MPRNPDDPKEVVFLPCKQTETPKYAEFVVFDQSQVFPQFIVHFETGFTQLSPNSTFPTSNNNDEAGTGLNTNLEEWTVEDVVNTFGMLNLSKDYTTELKVL